MKRNKKERRLSTRTALRVLAFFMCFHLVNPALANNAYIVAGGSVHRMSQNDSVSLESEVVRIDVGKHLVKVDCRFVFVNNGPACTVRMGFPDQTSQPLTDTKVNLRGSFLSYKSFVDQKEVKTQVVMDEDTGSEFKVWHAKDVTFPANGKRVVRDVYTVRPSVLPVSDKLATKLVFYILSTGSSWKGEVSNADVYVTFSQFALPGKPHFIAEKSIAAESEEKWWRNASDGAAAYTGPVAPDVSGRCLHFKLNKFRPTSEDNIAVQYDRMNRTQAIAYGAFALGHHFLKQNLPLLFRQRKSVSQEN